MKNDSRPIEMANIFIAPVSVRLSFPLKILFHRLTARSSRIDSPSFHYNIIVTVCHREYSIKKHRQSSGMYSILENIIGEKMKEKTRFINLLNISLRNLNLFSPFRRND